MNKFIQSLIIHVMGVGNLLVSEDMVQAHKTDEHDKSESKESQE